MTRKEERQVRMISFKIAKIYTENSNPVLQQMAFNELKSEYARKVLAGKFNNEFYRAIFVNLTWDDHKAEIEKSL